MRRGADLRRARSAGPRRGRGLDDVQRGRADGAHGDEPRRAPGGLGSGASYLRYFARPFVLSRSLVLTVGEVVKELLQARRQRARRVWPRVPRRGRVRRAAGDHQRAAAGPERLARRRADGPRRARGVRRPGRLRRDRAPQRGRAPGGDRRPGRRGRGDRHARAVRGEVPSAVQVRGALRSRPEPGTDVRPAQRPVAGAGGLRAHGRRRAWTWWPRRARRRSGVRCRRSCRTCPAGVGRRARRAGPLGRGVRSARGAPTTPTGAEGASDPDASRAVVAASGNLGLVVVPRAARTGGPRHARRALPCSGARAAGAARGRVPGGGQRARAAGRGTARRARAGRRAGRGRRPAERRSGPGRPPTCCASRRWRRHPTCSSTPPTTSRPERCTRSRSSSGRTAGSVATRTSPCCCTPSSGSRTRTCSTTPAAGDAVLYGADAVHRQLMRWIARAGVHGGQAGAAVTGEPAEHGADAAGEPEESS